MIGMKLNIKVAHVGADKLTTDKISHFLASFINICSSVVVLAE